MPQKPLTCGQVRKRRCWRCKTRRGHAVWAICADGNRQRVICKRCDADLNQLVLQWAGDRDWQRKMGAYRAGLGIFHEDGRPSGLVRLSISGLAKFRRQVTHTPMGITLPTSRPTREELQKLRVLTVAVPSRYD